MGRERRKNERLGSNLLSIIRYSGEPTNLGRGVVTDVSIGGFAIETETDLSIGQEYEFDIEIPITLRAKVVRSLTPGQMKKYGVQIKGQGIFSKILLKKLLQGKRRTIKFS